MGKRIRDKEEGRLMGVGTVVGIKVIRVQWRWDWVRTRLGSTIKHLTDFRMLGEN